MCDRSASWWALWCLLAGSAALGARPSPASGVVFTVDRTDDVAAASACDDATANDCSLRGAIARANADAAHDTVVVPGGTYPLTVPGTCTFLRAYGENFFGATVALCLNSDVEVMGVGAEVTTIQSNGTDRVFAVSAGRMAAIAGVTISGGVATFGFQIGGGGGILNHGTLAVSDCVLSGNRSAGFGGGGIYNRGALTVTRSRLDGNTTTGSGGAINNNNDAGTGVVDLLDSTLVGNDAVNGGGLSNAGRATVRRSTISGNAATSLGGGIRNGGVGKLNIVSSTISGNLARNGGGIENGSSSPLFESTVRLVSTTIAGNDALSAGGVSQAPKQTMTLRNTIIAGNTATTQGADCLAVELTSEGYNLVQDTTGCPIVGDTSGNLTGVNALLAPLAEIGGPTATHALRAASPAIDAGDPSGCTDLDGTALPTDQRGAPRVADGDEDGAARCDIGATELGRELGVASVHPREGGDGGPLIVVANGSGFARGATVTLVRAGQPDIVGETASVGEDGGVVVARVDLGGQGLGIRDVVVTNPDGSEAIGVGALTIAAARAPELWIEVLGPSLVRVGRSYRYLFRYGNRGNTDAFAVPLFLSVGESVGVLPRFPIAPPPQQFGETVIREWGLFNQDIIVGENPELRQISLVLPVVPAGFSGVLELSLTVPFTAENQPFAIRMEHGPPMYADGPDAHAVARLVRGAREKSERLFTYALPTAMDDVLTAHLTAQLETIVASGVTSLVESFGAAPQVYSLSQLSYELAAFGYIWSLEHPPPPLARLAPPGGLSLLPVLARVASGVADLGASAAYGQFACGCGAIPDGQLCCAGCSCSSSGDKDPKPPKTCLAQRDQLGKDDCKPPRTPRECREFGLDVVTGKDTNGQPVTICTNNRKCVFPNSLAPSTCIKFPVEPRVSHDPNDKGGPIGGGARHFLGAAAALSYTIQFENKPAATAPAAEVVIADQLDARLVDLATIAFGPIAFGEVQIVPPPGARAFAREVDLRPAQNLIVRIDARLDPATALVTWRLTALDPATMEIPDDPLLGFLPANRKPPEGDGYVSFSIAARPGLPDGTEIANQARIFFDLNEPIDTPVWRNVVDATAPESGVTSVDPAGPCSQDLDVTWSGRDAVAGIGAFSVLVSEDAGPFVPWLVSDGTGGRFSGKWGRSYAFRSVAEDLAGNVEDSSTAPAVSAAVPPCGPFDLAVTKIGFPRPVKLTDKRPARTVPVKVQIQNRSPQAQTIADAAVLAQLVGLSVEPLGRCAPPRVALRDGRPQAPLPVTLAPKQRLNVVFEVLVDCANDGAKGAGREDFRLRASVNQPALGGVDAHPEDDVCPRQGVKPAPVDPYPDGKIKDVGCGTRQAAGTLGGAVLLDLATQE